MNPDPPSYDSITTRNVTVISPMLFGQYPVQVTCGNCCRTIVTKTKTARGFCTYLVAYIVCIVFCPCVLIPLCSKECKDVHHFCPRCGAMLGVYRRI